MPTHPGHVSVRVAQDGSATYVGRLLLEDPRGALVVGPDEAAELAEQHYRQTVAEQGALAVTPQARVLLPSTSPPPALQQLLARRSRAGE